MNKAGQEETSREPDATLSIFDEPCFKFYIIKYCEQLGVESLMGILGEQRANEAGLSNFKQISYFQKIRIIDFILKTEKELGVEESSWRHCLLFLFLNGAISEQEFTMNFKQPDRVNEPRYR